MSHVPTFKPQRVTVYPSVAGEFPPASFWNGADSLEYMRKMQVAGAKCGLCQCPADSYHIHLPDTERPR